MEHLKIGIDGYPDDLFQTLWKSLRGDEAALFSPLTLQCSYGKVAIQLDSWFFDKDGFIYFYDTSDRESINKAIEDIEYYRNRYPGKQWLMLAHKTTDAIAEVIKEGARFAEENSCIFEEAHFSNRKELKPVFVKFTEKLLKEKHEKEELDRLKTEASACGIKPEVLTNINDILKLGVEENYHVRVMVVGKDGVGKSTLTRRLIQLPVDINKYKSTEGIEVHVRRCEVDLASGTWSKSHLSQTEKSFLKKFKTMVKLGKKTEKTGETRDYHERLAKVLQSTALPENLLEVEKEQDHDDPANSTETKQMKPEREEEQNVQQGGDVTELPTDPNEDAFTLTTQLSFTAEDIQKCLKKAKVKGSEMSRKTAKVSFYDFAGQEIYHASHPTFLDSKAIYIVVFDLRDTHKWQILKLPVKALSQYLESPLHWLHVIYMIDSPLPDIQPHVLLVGTHADKLPKKERADIIKKSFDGLREFMADSPFNIILAEDEYAVDSTKKNDPVYTTIKSKILELAALQQSWGETTPAKWMPLDRRIELLKDEGEKVISLEQLEEINRSLEVSLSSEEEITLFLQFLHSNGEIIYFNEKGLKNTIILDPVWMIDALKMIITAEQFAMRKHHLKKLWQEFRESGIITKSAIVSIFKKNEKDRSFSDNHEHLIQLMEKFLFIASPVTFPEDTSVAADEALRQDQTEISFIMPCMVKSKPDIYPMVKEGKCSTTVFSIRPVSNFLPPAVFHKVLATCITKWPIVEQNGRKLISPEICMFNIDMQRLYKLAVVHVQNEIHTRIISFEDGKQPGPENCEPVRKFLTQSVTDVLQGMGFPSEIMSGIQCPQFALGEHGGLFQLNDIENQKSIGCEDCPTFHVLDTRELLSSWIQSDITEDSPLNAAASLESQAQEESIGVVRPKDLPIVKPEHVETPITKEHINHMRICIALVNVCAIGLRDILASQLPEGYTNFYELLFANEIILRGKKQQFRPEQIKILYPDPCKRYTGTLDQCDITMLYSLIRNIDPNPVLAPITGWGVKPIDSPRDTTLGANVERIRQLRNTFLGHSPDSKVEETLFEETWSEICQCMADIENVIGVQEYRRALNDIKLQRFSEEEMRQLQREFRQLQGEFQEHVEEERSFLESLEEQIRARKKNLPVRTLEMNQ